MTASPLFEIRYNYRLSNVLAALVRARLSRLALEDNEIERVIKVFHHAMSTVR